MEKGFISAERGMDVAFCLGFERYNYLNRKPAWRTESSGWEAAYLREE